MNGDAIRVEVVAAHVERQQVVPLALPAGATVEAALRASGLAGEVSEAGVGVWGRVVPPETVLREGDRVEIYRPLTADPKEARRRRGRKAP